MAISQTKYVNIISQVGGAEIVSQRELIGRIFTSSILIPIDTVIEFSGGAIAALKSVGEYFGITSDEYARASDYFSFISKKGTQPSKISFANASTDAISASLIGDTGAVLNTVKSITAGELVIHFGETTYDLTSINLSSVTSFAEAAAAILSGDAASVLDCTYDSTLGRFVLSAKDDLSGTVTGVEISVDDTALAEVLGLTNGIYQPGTAGQTKAQALAATTEISNNFLTFMFIDTVTSGEALQIASWVNTQNVRYMFCVNATTKASAISMAETVINYSGIAVSFDPEDKAQIVPMSAFAAIDYTRPNAAINMMYQQHPAVNASVSSDTDSDDLDAARVNYYGRTQQAGQWIDFYQKGVLTGEIVDMGVFVNEAWLKDAISSAILNLRLALDTLPATSVGEGLVKGQISNVIDMGLTNGVINPGKTLSSTQKAYIKQVSGEDNAWLNVQSNGYWLGTEIVKETSQAGVETYKVHYTLIYAKGDAINKVDGTDILI